LNPVQIGQTNLPCWPTESRLVWKWLMCEIHKSLHYWLDVFFRCSSTKCWKHIVIARRKKKSPKTHRVAQTVRPKDLKLSQIVWLQIEGNLSEYEPDWPIGGATATKST